MSICKSCGASGGWHNSGCPIMPPDLMPMVIHVHHDTEAHARSFNEGYEAAVTQGLADDPSLADDWFQEKILEAKAEAFEQGQKSGMRHADRLNAAAKIGRPELPGPISPNPYLTT